MKKTYFNISLIAVLTAGVMMFSGCSQDDLLTETIEETKEETAGVNEDGTFTATFMPSMYEPMSRAAVEGQSKAIQSLKYLIYKDNGSGQYMYYGEGDVFGADADRNSQESHPWPYAAPIEVTLEAGNYKVAFLGNVNKNLFDEGCNELLTYTPTGTWEDVRINMPEKPFDDYNMFYTDEVEVSTENPTAHVWLERKVNKVQLWRETLSTESNEAGDNQILTALLDSVVSHLEGDDPLTTLLGGDLGDMVSGVINGIEDLPLLGGLVGGLVDGLINPLVNALAKALRPAIVEVLGPVLSETLKADTYKDQYALLEQILNPWAMTEYAAVTLISVPSSLNLDGKVMDFYENEQYVCKLQKKDDSDNFRYIEFTGLADGESEWRIGKINCYKQGLVGGLVIDGIVGDLLPGSLVDTGSELRYDGFEPNWKYESRYGAITLNVNDNYTYSEGNSENLKLTIKLGELLDLQEILDGIPGIGFLVGYILDPLWNLELHLTLPININALGTDTLELTGTWGTPQKIIE